MLLVALACTGPEPGPTEPTPLDPADLLFDAITEEALWAHLESLQRHADDNLVAPGVRDRDLTRAWARTLLEEAGYLVEERWFRPDGWGHTQCPDPECAGTNLVATWPDEPEGLALLVGAHLDTVRGAGIDDNGTGVATVLEIALQAAWSGLPGEVPLRFALWDGEETGMMGSGAYVGDIDLVPLDLEPAAVVDELLGYLNVDMIGSRNGVPGMYDVDRSHPASERAPRGSGEIESALLEGFDAQGIEVVQWPLGAFRLGYSDHERFADARVPIGALFTGAGERKTEEEATLYGGTAGEPYDSCYHSSCDDLDNVDPALMTAEARAAASAVASA